MSAENRAPEPAGAREHALVDIFLTLADTLAEDYDHPDRLDRLVVAWASLLSVSAAGLLLSDGQDRLSLVASSSEDARLLETFQLESGDGPCVESFRTGVVVASADLSADRARWPMFVPAALAAGFGSVTAIPLRWRDQRIGALPLLASHPGGLAPDDRRLALAFADATAIGILQRRVAVADATRTAQLQHALTSRIVIEQAKGLVAGRSGVSLAAAFDELRRHSQHNGLKLADVAASVVRGDFDPGSRRPTVARR
jgi:GAF domain-containing protein